MKFFHEGFLQEIADLVNFAEEILNGKRHFLCSDKNTQPTAFESIAGKNMFGLGKIFIKNIISRI